MPLLAVPAGLRFLGILVLGALVLGSGYRWFIESIEQAIEQTRTAMQRTALLCPVDSVERVSQCGSPGEACWERWCVKGSLDHGPYEQWVLRRLKVRGVNLAGKPHGSWVEYDDHRRVIRTTRYEAGMEV